MVELFISELASWQDQLGEAVFSSGARSRKPSKREDTRLDPERYDHPKKVRPCVRVARLLERAEAQDSAARVSELSLVNKPAL
jgi:hypothetical protein